MAVMTPAPESPGAFTLPDYDLVTKWCCAALHNDKGDSMLSYDIQAAVGNETFQRWTRTRLDSILGSLPLLNTQYQPLLPHQQQYPANEHVADTLGGHTVTFDPAVTPPRERLNATAPSQAQTPTFLQQMPLPPLRGGFSPRLSRRTTTSTQ